MKTSFRTALAFVLVLMLALASPDIAGAALKAGGPCTKAGQSSIAGGKKYTCVASGKKFTWDKGVAAVTPVAKPTTAPTPTAAPTAGATSAPATTQVAAKIPARNSVSAAPVATFPKNVVITADCSKTQSCPPPAPFEIALNEGCHGKVEATLQKKVNSEWVDVAKATGWRAASSCPASNPVRPYTTASLEAGTVIRWKVYSPGNWEWFSSESKYVEQVPVSSAALAARAAIDKLANEPASTYKATSPCQLIDQVTPNRTYNTDLSAGFPKVRTRIKSYGNVKALIVPVDFTDVVGNDNPVTFFTPIAQNVDKYFNTISYGRIAFDFTIVPNYVHMNFPISKYGMANSVNAGDANGYRAAVIAATDKEIDYAAYDVVYFLVPKEMPMSLMGWGPAITGPNEVSGGYIINGATGGADMYYNENNGIQGGTWKWMAHETGHAFGWYDEDYKHESPSLGAWGIMALNWTNDVIETNAWDRYLQGWLEESQIGCTSKDSLTTAKSFTLSALGENNGEQKTVMIPLSSSKILVMESRRKSSLDNFNQTREGLLVYTVDMTIGQLGGGYKTIRRTGSTDRDFRDAALQPGDSVTVDGITITVTSASAKSDSISVTAR
jgi:M6 family metalloprotease-like protein